MKNTKQIKFIKDIIFSGLINIVNTIRPICVLPFLTRYLSVEEYGVIAQIKITLSVMAPFLVAGLGNALVSFLSGKKDKLYLRNNFFDCFYFSLGMGLIVAAIFNIYAIPIGRFIFSDLKYIYLIKPLSLMLILYSLDYLINYIFLATRIIFKQFMFALFEIFLEVLLIIYFLTTGHGLATVIYCLLALKFIFVALKFIMIFMIYGITYPRFENLPVFLKFSLPLVLSFVFYFIIDLGDRYIINYILGLRSVGIYSVGYIIGSLIIVAMTPFANIFYPMIAELWNKKQFLKVKYYISYTLKLSLLVGIPTLIMVIFLSKYLIIWFSTPLFISAKIVIIFVAIAFFINGIGVVGECFITATKSTGLIMAIYSFLLFFNVAANFIFIKRFGISGAAMVTLLTYSLYTLLIFYFVQKKIYIRFKAREFFKYLLAASPLIATGIYLSIFRFNPPFFIWPIALSLILYILMLINLRLITKYDINLLRGVLVS